MIEKLLVRLIGDGSSYSAMLKTADAQTSEFSRTVSRINQRVGNIGRSMSRMGGMLTTRVTLPLLAIGALSVNAFAKFDQAMTQSTSIMDVTTAQVEQMRQAALSLSGEVVQGPTELAEAYYFLASAGMDAERSLNALPAVAKFATAGAFDMALATDLLTDSQTALGLEGKNAAENLQNLVRISDVFVAANQSANTSVQQVAEAMTADAGTAAQQMGQDLESVVAVLEAYASKGKKAAEAGNLYGRATRLLTSAARENEEVFKDLNIDVIDKSTGKYRDLINIIGDMDAAFAGMTKPQIAAKLELMGFRALAQKSITPLLGLSEQMSVYRDKLLAAGGATELVANKQMESFSNQMQLLKNQTENAAIELGEALAPAVLRLNQLLHAARRAFQGLSPAIQQTVAIGIVAAAALGPLLMIVGSLFTAASSLWPVISMVGGALASLAGGPIGVVIGALIGAVVLLRYFSGSWSNAAQTVANAMDAMVDYVIFGVRTFYRSFSAFSGWLAARFVGLWEVDWVSAIASGMRKAGQMLTQFASWASRKIRALFTGEETGTLDQLYKQLGVDANRGYKSENLLETLKGITGEEYAALQKRREGDQILATTPGREPLDAVVATTNKGTTVESFAAMAADLKKLVEIQNKSLNKPATELAPLGL